MHDTNTRAVKPHVELIAYTPDPEKAVAVAAKLCYSDADISGLYDGVSKSDVNKFIEMLVRLGHLSPIEHASFTFALEGVSRALLAQITRHRVASFSVKSQRYVGADKSFNYIIPPAVEALGADAAERFHAQMEQARAWYLEWQALLGSGERSNEDARFVLPNAAETKMIVTMNARELLHFFGLRCCNRAQWEIREVAWRMLGEVIRVAPSLFKTAGPSCCGGVCSEGKMSCGNAEGVRARHAKLLEGVKNL
ncbi:MAG: FAD-dependent thymidylate synthase [Clostridiales bacterium]|jgi:thymidylate synthase (FAD)|nr:FAD-dependent thymidylate synthase [Clostridiales bacterium]